MAVEFKAVDDSDLDLLLSDLRTEDIAEINAMTTKSVRTAIKESLALSEWALCAYCDGDLLAVFGLSGQCILTGLASPWMIGTNSIYKHKKEFWKASVEVVEWMKSRCDHLENFVHTDHKSAIAWLMRLGFSFDNEIVDGRNGSKFMRFHLCAL
ncbi:DUF2833 domain-containing protein [Vibrio parahaemolyticus]|nr:DUF2833 domain-containing protein [Vibrio parahaemolyticus]